MIDLEIDMPGVKPIAGERWRYCVGYEGSYAVSSEGRVASLPRRDRLGRACGGKLLKPNLNTSGYPFVGLYADGRGRLPKVHRLVVEAFVGPRPSGREIAHGDGVKTNNRLGNLRYATHAENEADKIETGTHNRGEHHGSAKLTERDVDAIRAMYVTGDWSQREIANRFGISQQTVSEIVNGKCWAHTLPADHPRYLPPAHPVNASYTTA